MIQAFATDRGDHAFRVRFRHGLAGAVSCSRVRLEFETDTPLKEIALLEQMLKKAAS